ncbi:CRISPR-associated endonuclease Cas6 [Fusobacterium sp. PH5-44]|uniref:CRISPR-associated endonuclease Cas6 n=1 Tax=unclassified Fusobacterium TaxID=2648384 RepID=UPI003D1FF3E6
MKLVEVTLETEEEFTNRDGEKLRGYIGNLFIDDVAFHNHKDSNSFNYGFSKIQYRVVDKKLTIIGIDEGGDALLEKISTINKVILDIGKSGSNGRHGRNQVPEKREIFFTPKIIEKEYNVTVLEKEHKYRFETPWIALNDKNYKRYLQQEVDLNKQLVANLLEFFKMCNVWVDKKITVIGDFQECVVTQKDTKLLGFIGEFFSNADIPSGISLGKRKSIGFGRIKKII